MVRGFHVLVLISWTLALIVSFCRDLLEQAVQKNDSLERLLLATAFTCASYYGSIHRDAKPFNPMLGETYEYQDNNNWFLAEQVCKGLLYGVILLFTYEYMAIS